MGRAIASQLISFLPPTIILSLLPFILSPLPFILSPLPFILSLSKDRAPYPSSCACRRTEPSSGGCTGR